MSWPTVSNDPEVQAFYEERRQEGASHKFAELLALQQPPGVSGTDTAFLRGHCCGNQFEGEPAMGDYYAKVAKAGGVDPTGKVYLRSLARFQGDPQAWVSGLGDVKRVADKENMNVEGAFNRTEVRGIYDGTPDVPLAADLRDNLEASYEYEGASKEEAKAIVDRDHVPSWTKE